MRAWIALTPSAYDPGMQRTGWGQILREAIPGGTVAGGGALLWAALRFAGPFQEESFVGWLFLLLLAGTLAAIALAARSENLLKTLRAGAILWLLVSMLIFAVSLGTATLDPREAATVCVLFLTWIFLWSAVAAALRILSLMWSFVLSLSAATLWMAAPIAFMPLVHAAAHWGPASSGTSLWQGTVVALIRHGCPFFPLLDALRPAIKLDWSHLAGMYEWSGLGQDVPMLLPSAGSCAAIYALTAVAFAVLSIALHRKKR